MSGDSKMVVVTEESCDACGTRRVDVHHQGFPELRIGGDTPHKAAGGLIARLRSNLGAVPDPLHRAPVEAAIADVQAFIDHGNVHQPKLSEVIDVRGAGGSGPGASPNLLAKGETLEIRRLILPQGRAIPTHHAAGEITVHCLQGRIEFTADGQTRDLSPGQLIVLAAGEPHSLVSLEDSTVLVTKIQPMRG
jgi:quercetin dioxygenase-like cupin family protein